MSTASVVLPPILPSIMSSRNVYDLFVTTELFVQEVKDHQRDVKEKLALFETRRKQAENELKHARAKAERSSRAKTAMQTLQSDASSPRSEAFTRVSMPLFVQTLPPSTMRATAVSSMQSDTRGA